MEELNYKEVTSRFEGIKISKLSANHPSSSALVPPTRIPEEKAHLSEQWLPTYMQSATPPSASNPKKELVSNPPKESHHDLVIRKTRSILNKITPEKFDKLCQEIIHLGLNSKVLLKAVAVLIFEKAIDEHRYTFLYANLCRRLYYEAPNFDNSTTQSINAAKSNAVDLKPNTFRRFLVAKLQDEFENRWQKLQGPPVTTSSTTPNHVSSMEANEKKIRAKRHVLGNVKFIGELYQLNLLQESIMHQCIKQLINNKKKKGPTVSTTSPPSSPPTPSSSSEKEKIADDLECLCQMLKTCGKKLDHEKARSLMDQYFDRLNVLYNKESSLPSRVRFMMQDVFDLRQAQWVPRQMVIKTTQRPKTLGQIRSDLIEEFPNLMFDPDFMRQHVGGGSGGSSSSGNGYSHNSSENKNSPLSFYSSSPSTDAHYMNGESSHHLDQGFDFFSSTSSKSATSSATPAATVSSNNHNVKKPLLTNGDSNGSLLKKSSHFPSSTMRENVPLYQNSNRENGETTNKPLERSNKVKPSMKFTSNMTSSSHSNNVSNGRSSSGKTWSNYSSNGGRKLVANGNGTAPRSYATTASPSSGKLFKPPSTSSNTFLPSYQHAIDKALQLQKNPPLKKSSPTSSYSNERPAAVVKKTRDVGGGRDMSDYFVSIYNDIISKEKGKTSVKRASAIPFKSLPLFLGDIFNKCIQSDSDSNIEKIAVFAGSLRHDNIINDGDISDCLVTLLKSIDCDKDIETSLLPSLIAHCVINDVISLADLSNLFEHGSYFPAFFVTLQDIYRIKGKEWLFDVYRKSNIEIKTLLPESSRNKDAVLKIMQDKSLSFLLPFLSIEVGLESKLTESSSPNVLYTWIKENVDQKLYQDPKFINVVVTSCLRYITSRSTLTSGVDTKATAAKHLREEEGALLKKLKPLIQKFVDESQKLQLHALYAVQVFCYQNQFPKGLMLRLFNSLYAEDVIDEEVFLKWKEDVNDNYEGKGKALFQVNGWLTWLQEPDTEDEEE